MSDLSDRNDPSGRVRDYLDLHNKVTCLYLNAPPTEWASAVAEFLGALISDRMECIKCMMTDDERILLEEKP